MIISRPTRPGVPSRSEAVHWPTFAAALRLESILTGRPKPCIGWRADHLVRRRGVSRVPQQVQGVIARSKDAPVELVTINVPDPGPGEAVVEIQACGVCHTDLHYGRAASATTTRTCSVMRPPGSSSRSATAYAISSPGDYVILNWRAVCGSCRACKRGRPWYCFATFNAKQKMTLEDGTELSPALGIGAFIEKTLVAAGQCTKVDPAARPAVAGLLGCGVMAGLGAAINTGNVGRGRLGRGDRLRRGRRGGDRRRRSWPGRPRSSPSTSTTASWPRPASSAPPT